MMENDTSNSHPESINVEDNDTNVELASNEEETCSLPISAPSTPKSDKPSKSWQIQNFFIKTFLKFR